MKEFGYIGVFLYNQIINTFSEKEFSRSSENFVYNLIQFYSKNFYLHFYESEKFDNVRLLIDIIANKFEILADLIKMDRIIKKEHIIVKSILDLIIHYYTKCELHLRNKILTNEIIPTSLIFYYKLNTADIVAVYMMIKNTKNLKGILGINLLTLENDLDAVVSNKKENYINNLIQNKKEIEKLYTGLGVEKFVL